MNETKQILFIVSRNFPWPDPAYLHSLIPQGYMPNVARTLSEAKILIDVGMTTVIIAPTCIPYEEYIVENTNDVDPMFAGTYCLWKKELSKTGIKTIIIDYGMDLEVVTELQKSTWMSDPNVRFFEVDQTKPVTSWRALVDIIKE